MAVRSMFFALLLTAFVTPGDSATALNTPKESVDIGVTVRVVCTLTGGETFTGWFRGSTRLSNQKKDRLHFDQTGDRYTLHIQHIVVTDGGGYTCIGSGSRKEFTLWVRHINITLNQYLLIGSDALIKTDVSAYPKPDVKWTKDGKDIIPITDATTTGRFKKLQDGSLKILRMSENDKGIYVCTVTHGAWFKAYSIHVNPYRPPEIIQGPVPTYRYVTKGYNTTFTCIVAGFPTPKIEWLNPHNKPVDTFDSRMDVKGNTFTIHNVEPNDKGNWTCKVTVGDKVVKATSAIKDVYTTPVIYEPAFPWVYYPELYKHYTITCKARGYPTPTVIIRKNGRMAPTMKVSPGQASIKFFLIREHDLGNYSCEAWGSARDAFGVPIVVNQTFAMFTKDKPVINPDGSPKVIYSYVGNTKPLRINCDFVSFPLANVTIWRGFYELTNGTDQATLYVWTYSWEDFGPYSCIGSNIFGEVNYTVSIKHATPPSKPTDININVTCDRAYFSWTPPNNTGGMEIDRYVIDYGPGSKYNTNDSYPVYRIWDLQPNTEYTVTIRAMNRQGPGAPATVIFRTNETCVPRRPEVIAPVEYRLDRNFINLRWKAPANAANWEGQLYYSIQVKQKDDVSDIGHSKMYTSRGTVQRIGGLRRNVTYRITIWTVTTNDMHSNPTYVDYYVDPNAWGSAHALTASLWSILLAALIALSMRS